VPSSLDLFRALAPDLCEETNARVGVFIEQAARMLCAPAWGVVYVDALVYLAAHNLTHSPASGGGGALSGTDASGPATSKKAGDLAVTFGAATAGSSARSNTDADLATTIHGRKFLALRDTRAAGLPFFAEVPASG